MVGDDRHRRYCWRSRRTLPSARLYISVWDCPQVPNQQHAGWNHVCHWSRLLKKIPEQDLAAAMTGFRQIMLGACNWQLGERPGSSILKSQPEQKGAKKLEKHKLLTKWRGVLSSPFIRKGNHGHQYYGVRPSQCRKIDALWRQFAGGADFIVEDVEKGVTRDRIYVAEWLNQYHRCRGLMT